MHNETRKKLSKATGELIESFVNFDRTKVLHFQAGLHAIHKAGQELDSEHRPNLYNVSDTAALEKLLAQYNVPVDDFKKLPDIMKELESGKPEAFRKLEELPPPLRHAVSKVSSKETALYDVPIAGMIAVTLNLVSPDVKNALIAGQAGERALKATERASSILSSSTVHNKESVLRGLLYDYKDTSKPATLDVDETDTNPKYLVAAKATNHLADLLEGGIKLAPNVVEEEAVKNALKTLKSLSIRIFNETSRQLQQAGIDQAAQQIGQLAEELSLQQKKNEGGVASTMDAALRLTQQGLEKIKDELRNRNIFTEQEAKDFEEMVNHRIRQISRAKDKVV